MRSAIIAVGTELLFGQVANTNAAYLSKQLNELGIDVIYHYTVGDNPGRLKNTLLSAVENCDIVLITGGLGPTDDDLTKETVSELMGRKLVFNQHAKDMMEEFFSRSGYTRSSNNDKQAYLPEDSVIFMNNHGTAPAFAVENGEKRIICLPGVPREMKGIFQDYVRDYLQELSDAYIYSRTLKIFGIGESYVESMIKEKIKNQTDPTIATYAKDCEVEIRVTSKRKTLEEAKKAAGQTADELAAIIGISTYDTYGRELYDVTAENMLKRGFTLSVCETITAGTMTSILCSNHDAVEFIDMTVCAPNGKNLGKLLDEKDFSPTQEELLSESAVGKAAELLRKKSGSDVCVAIAGNPDYKDVAGHKQGEFFVAVSFEGKTTIRNYYRGTRTRELSVEFMSRCAIHLVNQIISGIEPLEKLI